MCRRHLIDQFAYTIWCINGATTAFSEKHQVLKHFGKFISSVVLNTSTDLTYALYDSIASVKDVFQGTSLCCTSNSVLTYCSTNVVPWNRSTYELATLLYYARKRSSPITMWSQPFIRNNCLCLLSAWKREVPWFFTRIFHCSFLKSTLIKVYVPSVSLKDIIGYITVDSVWVHFQLRSCYWKEIAHQYIILSVLAIWRTVHHTRETCRSYYRYYHRLDSSSNLGQVESGLECQYSWQRVNFFQLPRRRF